MDPTSRTYTGMNAVVPPVRAGPPSLAQFTHIVKCGTTGLPLPSGVIQNHSRPQAVLRVPEVVALKRTSWSLNRRRLPTRQASATIQNYLGKLAMVESGRIR